jgi:hypothetical protein
VSSRTGDELIELLLAGGMDFDEEGQAANDLLSAVIDGYPAHNLTRLTRSGDRRAVEDGAFVVSELGAKAAEVLDEVDFLLSHPWWKVRFDALDAALTGASPADDAVLAKAVMLVADPEPAVRWKALWFLAGAATDQLEAAASHLPDDRMARLAAWLAAEGGDPAHLPGILNRLDDPDKQTRMFAAAAAARVAEAHRHGFEQAAADRHGIERAATSDDPDVRSFAERVISHLNLRVEIRARQEKRRRERRGK